MKLICLLLAVYVLLLSAKPCCADNDCEARVAGKVAGQRSPVKEKECPGCSPFFTCGSCVGFIISQPLRISLSVIAEEHLQYHAVYQQPYIEKITLFVWLPPKIS